MLKKYLGSDDCVFSSSFTSRNPDVRQPFKLTNIGEFNCGQEYFTERTRLKQFLLIYTSSGCGKLLYNETEQILKKGSCVIINCNKYQLYKTYGEEKWHFLWFHFTSSTGDDIESYINDGKIFLAYIDRIIFENYFNGIKNLCQASQSSSESQISLLIHSIITELVVFKNRVVSDKNHINNIEKSINFIKENYNHNITLDELAGICGFSKFYFIKLFKDLTGTTPYSFILITRINEAKRLLSQTNLTISEIAGMLGFSDSKNFILHFKKLTETTPHQYRLKNLY